MGFHNSEQRKKTHRRLIHHTLLVNEGISERRFGYGKPRNPLVLTSKLLLGLAKHSFSPITMDVSVERTVDPGLSQPWINSKTQDGLLRGRGESDHPQGREPR